MRQAMPLGPPGAEKVVLNIDSLWSGGPFETAVSWSRVSCKNWAENLSSELHGREPNFPGR
jgi:hypothetical protein